MNNSKTKSEIRRHTAIVHVVSISCPYFPLVSNYLVYHFSPVFGLFLPLLTKFGLHGGNIKFNTQNEQ
jgi:hypothetical protein